MHDRDQHHDDGDQDFLAQGGLQGVQGLVDQAGAVVEGHDGDLAHRAVGQGYQNIRNYALDLTCRNIL